MKNKTGIYIGIFAHLAFGQSVIEQIGWKGTSWSAIMSFLPIGMLILGALIGFYAYRSVRQKEDLVQSNAKRLDESARKMGLTASETACLQQLRNQEPSLQPQIILQSVSVFEKCVDKHINLLLSKKPGEAAYQEMNALISSIRHKAGFHHLPFEHPLVSTRNISIGQSGSIFGNDLRIPLVQRATVVDSDEFVFTLEYDSEKEDLSQIARGEVLNFSFTRKQDGLYGIPVRVAHADAAGSLSFYHTLELRRNQMRKYVRVPVNFPLRFRLLKTSDPEKSEIQRGERVSGKILDLSGGGLSFICERSLRPGDLISVSFSIPGVNVSSIPCKILRIGLQEAKSTTYYRHHGQFVQFEEQRKRDQIVKYVFEKQRQQNQWR